MLNDDEAVQYMDGRTDIRRYRTGKEKMIPHSDNRDFDYALAQTLAMISRSFNVLPGFAYYDDYDGRNAKATNAGLKGSDGTVLFGQRLLKELMSKTESPEVSVAAVCAHEFGHILQYKRGLHLIVRKDEPTAKRVELQADFFAGYFAGIRKLERPTFPAVAFAVTQSSFGDNAISDPDHHGTPQERGNAIVQGFNVAHKEKRELEDAIQISIDYVKQL